MTRPTRIALSVASLAAMGVLLAALPYIVGVDWDQVGHVLGRLNAAKLAGLTALWLFGLYVYTFVLTASLPGLSHWRAFMLNAAGSSVSNVLPFGGAAGVAVTFGMCRSWGFRNGPVAVSAVVTGVWNILVKLVLPVIGIVALLETGEVPDRRLGLAAVLGCAALLAIIAAVVLALCFEGVAERTRDLLLRLSARLPGRAGRFARRAAGAVLRLRHTTISVLRTGWIGLTLGMICYVTLQAALLIACLYAAGAMGVTNGLGFAEAVAAFALNRVLTTAVVTPGGTGISEMGTAALLIHLGAPAAPATTAVLLNMIFTHTLEIPLGGLAGAWWVYSRKSLGRSKKEPSPTDLAAL